MVLRAVQTPRVAGLPWALGLGFAADAGADAGSAVAVAVVDTVTGAATEAVVEVVGSALAVVGDVKAAEAGLVETVMVVMVEVVLLVLVLVLLLDALAAVVFAGSGPVAVEDQRRMERYMS